MKPKGTGGYEHADNGSPDMVCKCVDGESCNASPVDHGQDREDPEGDSGRVDGGNEEEYGDACKDAECRVNFLCHVQFQSNNAGDGDAVQGHDALREEHEEKDDRSKQEDCNNEKQRNHTFPFSAALAGTDVVGGPDTGTAYVRMRLDVA